MIKPRIAIIYVPICLRLQSVESAQICVSEVQCSLSEQEMQYRSKSNTTEVQDGFITTNSRTEELYNN